MELKRVLEWFWNGSPIRVTGKGGTTGFGRFMAQRAGGRERGKRRHRRVAAGRAGGEYRGCGERIGTDNSRRRPEPANSVVLAVAPFSAYRMVGTGSYPD
jgi:hypothetical protein